MCGCLRRIIAAVDTCTGQFTVTSVLRVGLYECKEFLCFEQCAVFRGSVAIHTQITS